MTARTTLIAGLLALAALIAAPQAAEAARREALTLWWVIFNNPEECADGCDGEDLANPAVAASVVYATGQFTGNRGAARLVASLHEQAPGFADALVAGPGLLDAEKAEIHAVVRSHGRRLRRLGFEQITRFADRGCEELGGQNLCRDIQFAVHPPGQAGSPVFWWPDLNGGREVRGASSTLWRDADGVRIVLETSVK